MTIKHTLNVPVLAPDESIFGLKFHQVAIYALDPAAAVYQWIQMGYDNWHRDTAVLVGQDRGQLVSKRAIMMFNYDIMPLELEYVSYMGRRNSSDSRDGSQPFLSHLSTIVEDVEEKCAELLVGYGLRPYHQFVTEQHTNPNVAGKKRFKEAIFDTASLLGFDIKLIQRVPWDYGQEADAEG
jgi:hypothetical protein